MVSDEITTAGRLWLSSFFHGCGVGGGGVEEEYMLNGEERSGK